MKWSKQEVSIMALVIYSIGKQVTLNQALNKVTLINTLACNHVGDKAITAQTQNKLSKTTKQTKMKTKNIRLL